MNGEADCAVTSRGESTVGGWFAKWDYLLCLKMGLRHVYLHGSLDGVALFFPLHALPAATRHLHILFVFL